MHLCVCKLVNIDSLVFCAFTGVSACTWSVGGRRASKKEEEIDIMQWH